MKKNPNDKNITMYTSQLKPVIQIKKYIHKLKISKHTFITFHVLYTYAYIYIYMHYVFMHVYIYFWHYMKCYKKSLI